MLCGGQREITITNFLLLFYSVFVLMQSKSSAAFWAVISHNAGDVAIPVTKAFFSRDRKSFCTSFQHIIYLSQLPIICKLNQHRPRTKSFKASVEMLLGWPTSIHLPSLGLAIEVQVHDSESAFCLHFIFPTRTSCEALSKSLLEEKPRGLVGGSVSSRIDCRSRHDFRIMRWSLRWGSGLGVEPA